MKPYLKRIVTGFFLVSAGLIISSCQSSSDDGDSSSESSESGTTPTAEAGSAALNISSKVSIVDAQEDSTYSSTAAGGSAALSIDTQKISEAISRTVNPGSFAAGSDYNQDETEFWVHESSVQAFSTVNEILCSVAQSRFDAMLNQGTYRAQIDTDQCSSSNDNASEQTQNSQNQSSSSGAVEYEEWIVNSSREENQPHIVKVWINEEASDQYDVDKLIMAKLEIYRSSTTDNPLGYFSLNFTGYALDNNGNADTSVDPTFKGYMRTVNDSSGNVLLQFSNSMTMQGMTFAEQATLSRSSDGKGSGTLAAPDWDTEGIPQSQTFNIAYNEDNFLRQKGSDTAQCFDRTNFETTIWDYGVYDDSGSRADIDSGFPIKFVDGSDEFYGWVGYYGLWMDETASVSNGDTVYKQEWSGGSTVETPYTVFQAGGRLVKHTKQSMVLGDLKNVPLQYGIYDDSSQTYLQYRVLWNGTVFKKTSVLDEQNYVWTEISPATTLDLQGSGEWSFNFWSEALGGSGSINIMDNTGNYLAPGNSSDVVFHVEDMVYPSDTVPATLICYENCPDPDALSDSSATSLSFNDDNWYLDATPDASNYRQYTFDSTSMELEYGGTPVVMTQENQYQPWGAHSGMLFEPTTANLDTVACDWDISQTCNWQAWDRMDTYYTWETGPESWNKFTAIKNSSNQFARFDPPLKLTYTHEQTDSSAYDYKYNGSKFVLEYSGFGNLHGIPGRCIDRNTGDAVSCEGDVRWIPEFSIKPGATVADAADATNEYVVKPLHGEQRMTNVALSSCSSLSLTTYSLPDAANWSDPAIGDKPTVADAPAVIGGVVQ